VPQRRFVYPEREDLTVVVRAAGERTEAACVAKLRTQLGDGADLHVLHERPFSRAVTRTFEIGASSGREFTVAVDADLILLDDAVERVREICGKMAAEAFCATPLFLCKSVRGFAFRGLHCYRSALLPEALSLTGELADDLRPESRYYWAMRDRGYTREAYAKALGLHEYEQSYRHIYLKAMLRARKDEFAGAIRDDLESRAVSDTDAMVALWAFDDVRGSGDEPLEYDWAAPLPRLEARMREAGLAEKRALVAPLRRGFALDAILDHDFRRDTSTEAWVREMHGFDTGGATLLESVRRPPRFTSAPAGVS
jgi:hypothetical protein